MNGPLHGGCLWHSYLVTHPPVCKDSCAAIACIWALLNNYPLSMLGLMYKKHPLVLWKQRLSPRHTLPEPSLLKWMSMCLAETTGCLIWGSFQILLTCTFLGSRLRGGCIIMKVIQKYLTTKCRIVNFSCPLKVRVLCHTKQINIFCHSRNSLDISDPVWPEREEVFIELKRWGACPRQ